MKSTYFTVVITMFLVFSMLTAVEVVYGLTVDEVKAHYKIDDSEFFIFMDEKYIVEAEDGANVVIRKLNPSYDEKVKNTHGSIKVDNEVYYFVLCEDEKHILVSFDDEKNYFQKYKDTVKLEKHSDFKNVSSYNFTYLTYSPNSLGLSDERTLATELIWLDKKQDEHCGSFMHEPKSNEYYDYVKDFYLFIMYEEMKRCTKMLENDIDYRLNKSAYLPYRSISIHDKELSDELKDSMEFLRENQDRSIKNWRRNNSRLEWYSDSVSNMLYILYLRFSQDFSDERPNIKGDYPVDDIELEEYLRWLTETYQILRGGNFEGFIDYYGTPLKYKITPDGLKVTSAGRDKILETGDDEYILREYKDYNMN